MDVAAGGGALLDRGVYVLSLAHDLLGQPANISAAATFAPSGVDTNCAITLTFAGGAVAVLWASFNTHGSNAATIFGTGGRITLHEPFFRPHRMTVTAIGAAQTYDPGPPAQPGVGTRVKENPAAQHVFRRLQALLPRRQSRSVLQPVPGTGYQYEADEVMRCIREGRLESETMPLDETVRVMETMDRVRAVWRPQK
jgi:predicted dehydrogenase